MVPLETETPVVLAAACAGRCREARASEKAWAPPHSTRRQLMLARGRSPHTAFRDGSPNRASRLIVATFIAFVQMLVAK